RPVLDELVDLLRWKQAPVPALVAGLAAALASTRRLLRSRRRRPRVLRRRQRRVPGTPVQTTLELGHPSLEPFIRLNQTPVRIHPRVPTHQPVEPQQQSDSPLAIAIEDRLHLNPPHTKPFATPTPVPAPPERLRFLLPAESA